jgi:hypothetical protein
MDVPHLRNVLLSVISEVIGLKGVGKPNRPDVEQFCTAFRNCLPFISPSSIVRSIYNGIGPSNSQCTVRNGQPVGRHGYLLQAFTTGAHPAYRISRCASIHQGTSSWPVRRNAGWQTCNVISPGKGPQHLRDGRQSPLILTWTQTEAVRASC